MAKIWTAYIIAPTTAMDLEVTVLPEFIKYDENEEVIGNYTLREYCGVNTNRVPMYTQDSEYFYFGWNFSDLENDIKNFKELMALNGYVLGTEDFTSTVENAYWILNADELDTWKSVTPHNVVEELIEEI